MTNLEINKKIAELKNYKACELKMSSPPQWGGRTMKYDGKIENRDWAKNIADAWELFEELDVLCVKLDRKKCAGIRYDAVIYDDLEMSDKVCVTAETAPLAICLAYIKWKQG